MVGKKGKTGRPRKYHNNPVAKQIRENALKYYYKHKEERLAYSRRYHKRIKDYADKHGISFEEARKIVGNQKLREKKQ